MTKTCFKFVASLAICAALTTGTAFARDNDHNRDKGSVSHQNTVRNRDRDRARDRWREREWREARERERRRDHRRNFMFGGNGQPYGWTQGRKTGWRNCDLPPGQAKKAGCNSTWYRTHRRGFGLDRDHDGDRD